MEVLSSVPCPSLPTKVISAVCLETALAVKPSAILTMPTKLSSS